MKKKKIYIGSSWKNEHGVSMLTQILRNEGYDVISWLENNYGEHHNDVTKKMNFEEWVNSEESNQSFNLDTDSAMYCHLFIYYAPAGKDAAAELGAAYGSRRTIFGLYAKGEDLGLMRKMVSKWFSNHNDLIKAVKEYLGTELVNY